MSSAPGDIRGLWCLGSPKRRQCMHFLLLLLLLLVLQLLLQPCRSRSPETSANTVMAPLALASTVYAAARSALLAGSGTAALANARGMLRADLSVNQACASVLVCLQFLRNNKFLQPQKGGSPVYTVLHTSHNVNEPKG